MEAKPKIKIPLYFIGYKNVGKTSMIRRLTKGNFEEKYKATVGIDYSQIKMLLNSIDILVQLWDTCGLEQFNSLPEGTVKQSCGLLVVYDISDRASFDKIDSILQAIDKETLPYIIIGNKTDVDKSERQVSFDEGKRKAMTYQVPFMETSCKSGDNLIECFGLLLKNILKVKEFDKPEYLSDIDAWVKNGYDSIKESKPDFGRDSEYQNITNIENNNSIHLDKNEHIEKNKKKKSGCCSNGNKSKEQSTRSSRTSNVIISARPTTTSFRSKDRESSV